MSDRPRREGTEMPSTVLTARLKLLRDDEARWKVLCAQPITDRPGQHCSGMLGFAFGIGPDPAFESALVATRGDLEAWLGRWGRPGDNLLHRLTTAHFYHYHMSGHPPSRWVLTHPDGLRRLDDRSYVVLRKGRSRRAPRRLLPVRVDGSDYQQVDWRLASALAEAGRVLATLQDNAAAAYALNRALSDEHIRLLAAAAGNKIVIGHRPELPAVVRCPHCQRSNDVPVPEWSLDYGIDSWELPDTWEAWCAAEGG